MTLSNENIAALVDEVIQRVSSSSNLTKPFVYSDQAVPFKVAVSETTPNKKVFGNAAPGTSDPVNSPQFSQAALRAVSENRSFGNNESAAKLNKEKFKVPGIETGKYGVFEDVESAYKSAEKAFRAFKSTSLETRKKIIDNMRKRAREHVEEISRYAVYETGMGRIEDKMAKNTLVIDKTPGTEVLRPIAYTGDNGLTLVERAPYGVIGAISPSTNPSETIICNGIGMIAAGNAVVFNSHPSAKGVSNLMVTILNKAIVEAGGPSFLLNSVADPTIASGGVLMKHPGIRLLVVTGGPGVVEAAFKSGKKVIAAGPGNPPAVVDETADIAKAARDIVFGATLDNNILCIAEKEIIAVEQIASSLIEELKKTGVYWASPEEVKKLEKVCLTPEGNPNRAFVGKNANVILKEIGVSKPDSLRMISCEVPFEHPFVQEELLMPVVPLVRARNVDHAIELAVKAEHGFAHTATMHSKNIDNLHRMAVAVNSSIFVKNGPSCAGLGYGGEGCTTMSIASPTGEGITNALTFTRERRCVLIDSFRIV